MKRIVVLSLALGGLALADSAVPQPFARERYNETFAESPFALATVTPPPPPPGVDPLKDLVVTGLGMLEDGREFVVVQRTGKNESMRFESNEPNREGFAVKQVNWGSEWKQSNVVITYDGRERAVEFNQAPVVPKKPVPPDPQGDRRRKLGQPPGLR